MFGSVRDPREEETRTAGSEHFHSPVACGSSMILFILAVLTPYRKTIFLEPMELHLSCLADHFGIIA